MGKNAVDDWNYKACVKNDGTRDTCMLCNDGSHFVAKKQVDTKSDTIIGPTEDDYKKDSIVSERADYIKKTVGAHWSYVDKVIRSGAVDTSRCFTFEEVMKIREWDYTSAATHFFGHGFEEGLKFRGTVTTDG